MEQVHPALTPNQIVAYNLTRARRLRGLTQEQAAEKLEPFIGERWSKATYSAVERSVAGSRIRRFDANDLVAFSRAFELPLTYFLLPPNPGEDQAAPMVSVPDGETSGRAMPAGALVELLFRPDELADRFAEIFGDETHPGWLPIDHQTNAQRAWGRRASEVAVAVIRSRISDVEVWRRNLLDMAAVLDGIADEATAEIVGGAK